MEMNTEDRMNSRCTVSKTARQFPAESKRASSVKRTPRSETVLAMKEFRIQTQREFCRMKFNFEETLKQQEFKYRNKVTSLLKEFEHTTQNLRKYKEVVSSLPGLGDVFYSVALERLEQDHSSAKDYLKAACIHGHTKALFTLGKIYLTGQDGVQKADYEKAYKLLRGASEQNDADACFEVGRIFEEGIGKTRDLKAAIYFYQKASYLGNTKAKTAIERLSCIRV